MSYNLKSDDEDEGNESYDNKEPVDTSSDDEDNVTLASIIQNKEHKKAAKKKKSLTSSKVVSIQPSMYMLWQFIFIHQLCC